jgi:DMSO/TMAO reductase YedYZ molybdopterin-dependent catalytic subunit
MRGFGGFIGFRGFKGFMGFTGFPWVSLAVISALALASPPTVAQQAAATTVKITGGPHPLELTRADLLMMPRTKLKATSHDVTNVYEGVSMRELLTRAGVPEGESLRGADLAKSVMITGADGYKVAFGIAEFDPAFTDRVSLLADTKDGEPLTGNAAPFQLVLEGEKRPARWVRQVIAIEIR